MRQWKIFRWIFYIINSCNLPGLSTWFIKQVVSRLYSIGCLASHYNTTTTQRGTNSIILLNPNKTRVKIYQPKHNHGRENELPNSKKASLATLNNTIVTHKISIEKQMKSQAIEWNRETEYLFFGVIAVYLSSLSMMMFLLLSVVFASTLLLVVMLVFFYFCYCDYLVVFAYPNCHR